MLDLCTGQACAKVEKMGLAFSFVNSPVTAYDIKLDNLFKKELQQPGRSFAIDLNTPL